MHARGLRLRGARWPLARARPSVWPSASWYGVGAPVAIISQLNTLPACAPVNASMAALRPTTHDSGSGWVASPFLCDSCIHDSAPVYPGAHHGLLTDLHREARLEASRVLSVASTGPLLANQCCTIVTESSGKVVLAIYKAGPPAYFRLVRKPDNERGIAPMNVEQQFALALLTDPEILLVTLVGRAGSGKTLMALLAGYLQLRETYGHLLIYRPNIEIGQSLGYLPGRRRLPGSLRWPSCRRARGTGTSSDRRHVSHQETASERGPQ